MRANWVWPKRLLKSFFTSGLRNASPETLGRKSVISYGSRSTLTTEERGGKRVDGVHGVLVLSHWPLAGPRLRTMTGAWRTRRVLQVFRAISAPRFWHK